MESVAVILAEIEEPTEKDVQKVWRFVVEEWLIENDYVTEKTTDVSPSSSVPKCS